MALSLRASGVGYSNASGTNVTAAINSVVAGNLLVAWVSWEAWGVGSSDRTVTISDGTTSFAIGTKNLSGDGAGGEPCGYFGRLLSANAGNKTFTATVSGNVIYRFLAVLEFSVDAGDTVAVDQENATAEGSSNTPTSGSLATTGDDVAVVAGAHIWTAYRTWSNQLIGSNAPDGIVATSGNKEGQVWYKITTLSGVCAATFSGAADGWVCSAISFKSTAAAGGLSIPVRRPYTQAVNRAAVY